MNSTISPDLESDTDTETDTSSILSNTTWEILGVATEYQIEESLDNYEDLIDFYLSDDHDDDDHEVEEEEERESFQQDSSTKPCNTKRNVQTTTTTARQDDYNNTLLSSSLVSDGKELLISDRNKRQRTEINSNDLEFPDFTEIQEINSTTTDINKQVSNHKYAQNLHVVVTDTKFEDWITFASNVIYKK